MKPGIPLLLICEQASFNLLNSFRFIMQPQRRYIVMDAFNQTPESIAISRYRYEPALFVLMPCEDKLEVFRALLRRYEKPRILVMGEDSLREAAIYLTSGAAGYMYHREMSNHLLFALDRILTDGMFVNRHLRRVLMTLSHPVLESDSQTDAILASFTEADRAVVRLIRADPSISYDEMAGKLHLSKETIKKRVYGILRKANLRTRRDLLHFVATH